MKKQARHELSPLSSAMRHLLHSVLIIMGLGLFMVDAEALTKKEQNKSLEKTKQYLADNNCVDAVLEAAGVAYSGGDNSHLARYYIAVCQDKLGDPSSSLSTLSLIDQSKLNDEQRSVLQELVKRNVPTYESRPFAVTLSYGLLNFENDPSFKDGHFTDLIASYANESVSLTIGGETVDIKQVKGSTYSQTQVLGVGEYRLMQAIGLKLGYRQQSSSEATVDGSSNTIIGIRWFNERAQVGYTRAASSYDNYYPSVLRLAQNTFDGSYAFGDYFETGVFTLSGKVFQISPEKIANKPGLLPATQLKKQYASNEVGVRYAKGSFVLGASLWSGEQVFAVLGDGFLVYSNSNLHTGGQKFSFDYDPQGCWSLGLMFASENMKFTSSSKTGHSTTSAIAGSIKF